MTKTYLQRSYTLFLERHDAKCAMIEEAHERAHLHNAIEQNLAKASVRYTAAMLLSNGADPDSVATSALNKADKDYEALKEKSVKVGYTDSDNTVVANYEPYGTRMMTAFRTIGKTYSYVVPVVDKIAGGAPVTSKIGEAVAIALSVGAEDIVKEAAFIYQIRQYMVPSDTREALMQELDSQVSAYKAAVERSTTVNSTEFVSGNDIKLVLGDMSPDSAKVISERVQQVLAVAERLGRKCNGEVRQSGPKSARFFGIVAGKRFDGVQVDSSFESALVS